MLMWLPHHPHTVRWVSFHFWYNVSKKTACISYPDTQRHLLKSPPIRPSLLKASSTTYSTAPAHSTPIAMHTLRYRLGSSYKPGTADEASRQHVLPTRSTEHTTNPSNRPSVSRTLALSISSIP